MAQVSGIEIAISADTSNFDRGLANATSKLQSFGKLAATSLAVMATAASAGVIAFGAMTRQAINFADEIGKTAQKIGMTSESLSKLEYAAKLSDVSLGQLQVGLGQLSKNMQSGNDAFAALGVTIADEQGNLRSTEEVFLDLAERFSEMENGAGKTALMMQIFGRSGADLIPLMNGGREAIKGAGDELQRFGGVISGEVAAAAEQFNDNLTKMQVAGQSLVNQALIPMLPAMENVTGAMVDFVAKGQIAEQVAGALEFIMKEMAIFVSNASAAWEELTAYVVFAGEAFDALTNLDPSGIGAAWAKAADTSTAAWARNAETVARIRGEVQSVNSALKGDLGGYNNSGGGNIPPPPGAGGGDKGEDGATSIVPGVAPSQEVGRFFIDRLQSIRDGFMTEREALVEEYNMNQAVLDNAFFNEDISRKEHMALTEQLAKEHAAAMADIQQRSMDDQLSDISTGLGRMASAFQSGGSKMLKISKVFAAAQAIVDTIKAAVQAMANPALIDPASKFAAYATVFAKGMSAVAAIKGVSEGGGGSGGGGGGGSRGGGGGGAAPAAASPTTTFQFTMMNDPMGFGEKFARQFIDQLNSTQRNGGTIRGVIA